MFSTVSNHSGDASLAELVQYSSKALLRKPTERSPELHQDAAQLSPANWSADTDGCITALLTEQPISGGYISYAAPLMPLRERDMKALAELFDHAEIEAIEENIAINLRNMLPEPCWDDDPFEFLDNDPFGFLKDYL